MFKGKDKRAHVRNNKIGERRANNDSDCRLRLRCRIAQRLWNPQIHTQNVIGWNNWQRRMTVGILVQTSDMPLFQH